MTPERLAMLSLRADMLARSRDFFAQRQVMEVDVPVMSAAAVTDPNIECLQVRSPVEPARQWFLMPSPEFYMKRLLVAGSGPIYSLGHAFRAGEQGRRHQQEFTMLEWYRPEWDLRQLMEEVQAYLEQFMAWPVRHLSYRNAFIQYAGLDPFGASLVELKQAAQSLSPAFDSDERDVWLDLLFSHCVEPALEGMVFISDFPAAQAALAQTALDAEGHPVACRFEVYVQGVELANAYLEETDAGTLATRFAADRQRRAARGQILPPVDQAFLSAMQSGLPPCAGVALGFDRLVMLVAGQASLAAVMPFAGEE